MGLGPAIDRVGYHVRELHIVNDRGVRVAGFGTSAFQELTGGRYVSLRRSDLSRLLLEKLRSRADVIYGDEIAALDDRGDHVRVGFRRIGERRFDLVIGADGLHSAVRGFAFGPQEAFETPLGYLVAALEARGYRQRDEDVYVAHGAPGRQLARFALREAWFRTGSHVRPG